MFIFYVCLAFALMKMIAAGKIQEAYKIEFERQGFGNAMDLGRDYDDDYEADWQ